MSSTEQTHMANGYLCGQRKDILIITVSTLGQSVLEDFIHQIAKEKNREWRKRKGLKKKYL